jgi:hypothetical protein
LSPGRWESVKLVQFFFRHTQKKGMVRFFYIENTQKTILKTRLYELIRSAFSQPHSEERFLCVRCAVFVMTNEKRKKTRNTYYFYFVKNSRSPLKIIKFSHSLFCHCSARAKLFKKKTPNYPACRTNCMQDNISVHQGSMWVVGEQRNCY